MDIAGDLGVFTLNCVIYSQAASLFGRLVSGDPEGICL